MNDLVQSLSGVLREWLPSLEHSSRLIPDWILAAAVLAVLALSGWALHTVLVSLLRSVVPRSQRIGLFVLRRVRRPMLAATVFLVVTAGLPLVPWTHENVASARAWMLVGLVASLGWLLVGILRGLADASGRRYVDFAGSEAVARRHFVLLRFLRRGAIVAAITLTAATGVAVAGGPFDLVLALLAGAAVMFAACAWHARSVLANLVAGVRLSLTRPLRAEDTVTLGDGWGWIEEIAPTYVIVRAWDWRRVTLPLTRFVQSAPAGADESEATIRSSITWHVGRRVSAGRMRERMRQLVRAHPAWDGTAPSLEIVSADNGLVKVRATVSAPTPADAWALRCDVREQMIAWLQDEYPDALPDNREALAERFPAPVASPRSAEGTRPPALLALAGR